MLAVVVILHRFPGVISPSSFSRFVRWYTETHLRVIVGGTLLILFSLWGIYVTLVDYPDYGWPIIGLSIVLLNKALKFVAKPSQAAADERHAWDQTRRNVFLICLCSVLGGAFILLFALTRF